MNLQLFELAPVEVERFQVKEVLRCLLHTILFNRALGTIKPKEVECDVFDITYARVDDDKIHKEVEGQIEAFDTALTKAATPAKTNTCVLSFYDKVKRTRWGGLSSAEEKVYWEQWAIPIAVAKDKPKTVAERDRRHLQRQSAVRERLFTILSQVNDKRDHIPPFKKEIICFPFEITFANESSDSGWGMFKRMVQQGPPLLIKN